MLKGFRTEILPTEKQADKIRRTIGTCRYVKNFYIAYNIERHNNGESFMSGREFSVWLNNQYLPNNPDKLWIKEVSSKSVKQAIMDTDRAFRNFFAGKTCFPKFQQKGKSSVKMYFIRDNPTDCLCERHRIKIPTLGWVRLKEYNYIPISSDGQFVRSGCVSVVGDRFYVSVIVDVIANYHNNNSSSDGLGIDLGIKYLAVCSDGRVYESINKVPKILGLYKQLSREQRALSRKLENKRKGGVTQGKNIQKQIRRVQRINKTIVDIRTDYINKTISEIVKSNPAYITIEDLNISGMMKNKYLSKSVQQQCLYDFRVRLTNKCRECGIELRVVDRWYPSSKLCHNCGQIKSDLKLSDRVYRCDCGYVEDRDFNASLNLRDAKIYTVIK